MCKLTLITEDGNGVRESVCCRGMNDIILAGGCLDERERRAVYEADHGIWKSHLVTKGIGSSDEHHGCVTEWCVAKRSHLQAEIERCRAECLKPHELDAG